MIKQKCFKFCSLSKTLSSSKMRGKLSHNHKTMPKMFKPTDTLHFPKSQNVSALERFFHHSRKSSYVSTRFGNPVRNLNTTSELCDPEHDITKLYRTKILYKNILESFPQGIQMAFAYGSGAIKQDKTEDMSKNMLDFIFVVDDPLEWHQANLKLHSKHYSFLRFFGPHGLTRIQDRYGGGTYFNTLVPMHGRMIKYGIISTQTLVADLLDWESLYISGRLQKPVNLIIAPKDCNLVEALIENLESAVHTALLLLPDVFTEEQLYITIASLSYSGDIRMGFAEDNNKVINIVTPNMSYFRRMYMPIISKLEHVVFWQETGQIEQSLNFESRHYHLTHLPSQVLQGLLKQKYQAGTCPDLEEVIRLQAYDDSCGTHVYQSISQIVKKSSTTQTVKGLFMAGVLRSIRYGLNKVTKKIKSR